MTMTHWKKLNNLKKKCPKSRGKTQWEIHRYENIVKKS